MSWVKEMKTHSIQIIATASDRRHQLSSPHMGESGGDGMKLNDLAALIVGRLPPVYCRYGGQFDSQQQTWTSFPVLTSDCATRLVAEQRGVAI